MVVVCMSSTYNIYMVYPQQQRSELNVRSACYPGPILRGQKNGALDFNTHSRVDSYYSPRGKSRSTPITAHIHTAQKKYVEEDPKRDPKGKIPLLPEMSCVTKTRTIYQREPPNQFQQCKSHQFMRGCTKYIFIPHIILRVFVYFLMVVGIVFFILQICGVFSFLEKCHLLCNKQFFGRL